MFRPPHSQTHLARARAGRGRAPAARHLRPAARARASCTPSARSTALHKRCRGGDGLCWCSSGRRQPGEFGLKGYACRRLVLPRLGSLGAECKRLNGPGRSSSATASAASGAAQQGQPGPRIHLLSAHLRLLHNYQISTARLQAACTASPRLKASPGAAWGDHTDQTELQLNSASRSTIRSGETRQQVLKLTASVVPWRPEGRCSCLNVVRHDYNQRRTPFRPAAAPAAVAATDCRRRSLLATQLRGQLGNEGQPVQRSGPGAVPQQQRSSGQGCGAGARGQRAAGPDVAAQPCRRLSPHREHHRGGL